MHQNIMPITTLKTSQDLSYSQPADISRILSEVKQHGFYSAFCAQLMPNISEHNAIISAIEHLAARAKLQVTFNAEESICIFEAY